MSESSRSPLISVIIPTYNRAAEISGLVAALQAQTLPAENFEVLLVDDGSTDRSRELLRGLGANFRVLDQVHAGASRARNLGAQNAQGVILAFTDDDCRPAEDWLQIIREHMEANQYGVALLGHTYSEHPSSTFVHSVFKDSEPVVTCNFAVSREAFFRVGGFDEHFILYFEDEDLGLRLKKAGCPTLCDPAMRVLHPSRYQSFRGFLRLRSAMQYLSYMSQKHPDGDHWERYRSALQQIRRKLLVFGAPLIGSFIWPQLWAVFGAVLLAHFAVDGLRAWRQRRPLLEAGFSLRYVDFFAFTFGAFTVPFVDLFRILKGYFRDRGTAQPWKP